MLFFYLTLIDDDKDKSKFEIIYYEYRERMYAAAFEILNNKQDSEDAVHNAFVGIANNMKSIDEAISKRTLSYCIKAARNSAINIYNKNNKIKFLEYSDNLKISDEDFFNMLFEKESYEAVVEAIKNLKDIYKIPMYYHYVCDMKIKDIASLLDLKPNTVSTRIIRGKAELLNVIGDNDDC
ncbi:MAG: sigma-70 family RNA polymerase sigma factor [Ruminococcaceae bacterium]|nr:sigma-70 family RNA polymerase sigma factor [Oscillospiraceae bacterium]